MSDNLKTSALATALGRVTAVLDRLEAGIQQRNIEQGHQERHEQHLTLVVNENRQLQDEQQKLNQAIDELQTQYDDLHKVAVNIYGRLDDSVRRITKIIGH